MPRTVYFFRDFRRLTGGHLKVWHYFQHVTSSERFRPRIRLTPESVSQANPWAEALEEFQAEFAPTEDDVLFVAGLDWKLLPQDRPALPTVNLVQHVRHAERGDPRFKYLSCRAIRVCVSPEVEAALTATGRVNGPVVTIPAGIDIATPFEPERTTDVVVAASKDPALGRRIADQLRKPGRTVELLDVFVSRDRFLDRIASAKVAVTLPHRTEGFFLPALESMALGTVLVCPDCVANRSFCEDGTNCFRPAYDEEQVVSAAETALRTLPTLGTMIEAGLATARRHSLRAERKAFLDVLDRIDRIWEAGKIE